MRQALQLTPRLQAVADLVPQGAAFADIGTDHAYLPAWLLLNGRIDRAIASDINAGPLSRARKTAEEYGCTQHISFRLGAGLAEVTPEEADTVAIAGMGGETIAQILTDAPWTREQGTMLILQPMSAQEDLRRYLWHNGYIIRRERIVREGQKLYLILEAAAGKVQRPPREAEYRLGRMETWEGEADLRADFLAAEERRLTHAMAGLSHASREEDRVRLAVYQQVLNQLNEMREEWLRHGNGN